MHYQERLKILINRIFNYKIPVDILEKFITGSISSTFFDHKVADLTQNEIGGFILDSLFPVSWDANGVTYEYENFEDFLTEVFPDLWNDKKEELLLNFQTISDRARTIFEVIDVDQPSFNIFLENRRKYINFYDFLIFCEMPEPEAITLDNLRKENPGIYLEDIIDLLKDEFRLKMKRKVESRDLTVKELAFYNLI